MDLPPAASLTEGRPAASSRILAGGLPAALALLLVVALTYLRDPRYFLQPRFWAEEGSLHFAFSYSHGWLQALFQPQLGYLNFWPNLATLLATLPPLEYAPLVTTMLALLVQLLPIALILWSPSPLWQGWVRKALGAAVVLLVPITTEVWLNSVNSYTYFAVIAFLLLIEEAPAGRARSWIYRLLLAASGLTGTLACFLTPLFLYRAWEEKKPERWRQALILVACCAVQAALIFSYRGSASVSQRFTPAGLTTLGGAVWAQSIGLLAAGLDRAHEFGRNQMDLMKTNPAAFKMWGRGLLAAALVVLAAVSANIPLRKRLLFLASYALLIFLPLSFSVITEKYTFLNTGVHSRLFLAPNILLGWMLVANLRPPAGAGWRLWAGRLSGLLAGALLAAALVWGAQSFRQTWIPATAWPDWKQEVQAWRANPGHALKIQPADQGWVVKLTPR